ncbi:MAG: hypothetical protein MZW92_58335 [Comamonadaceae bacterium]|nr:hypothetical protein [Comamonadaceae bacterium]
MPSGTASPLHPRAAGTGANTTPALAGPALVRAVRRCYRPPAHDQRGCLPVHRPLRRPPRRAARVGRGPRSPG